MSVFKDHKISLKKVLDFIPEALLSHLSVTTKVDHYSKVLHGKKMFYLLLFCIFDNEKLSLVRMQQISGSPRVGFDTMKTLLIQKYGKPMDYNESTNSLVWVNEGVTIRLANIFDKLVITYKVDTSKEANKL